LTEDAFACTRARLTRWICIGCGHEWHRVNAIPRYCRQCGVVGGYAPEEIELLGTKSDEIATMPPGVFVEEWKSPLPRGLPLGRSLLLRGRPGGGKSRSAFRLSSQIGPTMAFGLEMGKELSVETATLAGANLHAFTWYSDIKGLSELELVDPAVVVIDSIQKLGRARGSVLDDLMTWARERERNCVFVSQLSADGKSRYGEDADFDCDMNCDVGPTRTAKGGLMQKTHAFDDKPTKCKNGHAHVSVAKSRVCPLISFDVPIVDGC
jgi:hypothetical protein